MASPACPVRRRMEADEAERPPPALTDDLLEEIFLRVGAPADLVRASTAFVSFHRLITDPYFLRRYRAIHPPLLLGFLSDAGFLRAEPPHPSSPAAGAHALAANFSFNDYLPRARGILWFPSDVRDGRVLLYCMPNFKDYSVFFPDLAVCDPFSQRYILLPPIPDHLVASVQTLDQIIDISESLLVPSGQEEVETSFRVICCMRLVTRFVVFIYCSVSGDWSVTTSPTWHSLGLNVTPPDFLELETMPQCTYGCFYWQVEKMNKLLKLDMNIMKFSTNDLPPGHDERNVFVVEGGEGKAAMFIQNEDGTSVDYYTHLQDGNERANEWHMKNTIPLPFSYNCYIIGSGGGYVFLVGCTLEEQDTEYRTYFSLDIKTFNIEKVCTIEPPICIWPYYGFPPFMSPARIQG